MRRTVASLLCLLLLLPSFAFPQKTADTKKPAQKKKDEKKSSHTEAKPERKLTERERALHALNRLTFGPRPGDVDRVMAMGVDQWVEQQLGPATDPDPALDARLAPLRTLQMQPAEMMLAFPNNNYVRQVMDKKRPYPNDP